jgi:hypothetical protein
VFRFVVSFFTVIYATFPVTSRTAHLSIDRSIRPRLLTLIRQRHLTPSCGGQAPTAERTVGPARILKESLTPIPELENKICHKQTSLPLAADYDFIATIVIMRPAMDVTSKPKERSSATTSSGASLSLR